MPFSVTRKRRLARTVSVAGVVLLFLIYSLWAAKAPLALGTAQFTLVQTTAGQSSEDAQTIVDALAPGAGIAFIDAAQTTDGLENLEGLRSYVNSDQQFHIASITKVITVLTVLAKLESENKTLADLGTYTVGDADAALLAQQYALGGSASIVDTGTTLSAEQVVYLIMLESANNYAIALGRWVFGSDEKFATAANEWLAENGFTHTRIVEASGIEAGNVSTPAELLRLGAMAATHPVLGRIDSTKKIEIPGAGEIENTNRLLHEGKVDGGKTGTFDFDYINLVAHRYVSDNAADGKEREIVVLATVLGRDSYDSRDADIVTLMSAAQELIEPKIFLQAGQQVGHITRADGAITEIKLASTENIAAQLLPDESLVLEAEEKTQVRNPAEINDPLFEVQYVWNDGVELMLPIVPVKLPEDAGFWWRFWHPFALG